MERLDNAPRRARGAASRIVRPRERVVKFQITIYQQHGSVRIGGRDHSREDWVTKTLRIDRLPVDAAGYLANFQELLSLARETLPQLSAEAARKSLTATSSALGLELV